MRRRRNQQGSAINGLKPVPKHRAVDLHQDRLAHLDYQVGPYSEDVPVEGGVVQRAQRETVGDDRLPEWMPVRKNMGGLEEFGVFEAAHRALLPIGP